MNGNRKTSIYIALILIITVAFLAGCSLERAQSRASEDGRDNDRPSAPVVRPEKEEQPEEDEIDDKEVTEESPKPESTADASEVAQKVYDEADLFSPIEEAYLQKRAEEMVEEYRMDIVIVTITDSEGKSSMEYADDFYDNNGFGCGGDKSGLLMLIDMDNRNVWINTTGKAIPVFTEDRINGMLDVITPHLSDERYIDAAEEFLKSVKEHLDN